MYDNQDLLSVDQPLNSDIQTLENPEGELHLRLFLPSGEEFALAATGIAEVMQQPPANITPIPNASPLLLGTINLRGKVIWVADLGQFLGDRAVLNTDRPEIPVVAIEDGETVIGLAIEKVGDIEWLATEKLQTADNLSESMNAFVIGQWQISQSQQPLKLLDPVAIINSSKWAA
jgi:twitching motility protein PilI